MSVDADVCIRPNGLLYAGLADLSQLYRTTKSSTRIDRGVDTLNIDWIRYDVVVAFGLLVRAATNQRGLCASCPVGNSLVCSSQLSSAHSLAQEKRPVS